MECNLLNSNINSCDTKTHKGFKRRGWFTMHSNIDQSTVVYDGCKVDFDLVSGATWHNIFDDSVTPFAGSGGKVEASANHGYKFFNPTVKFPLKRFAPESAQIIKAMTTNNGIVVILEQEETGTDNDSKWAVFGLQSGLFPTTPVFEMANDSVWEVELMETRADYANLFFAYPDYIFDDGVNEAIRGLRIDTDGAINIEVDSDKTCYCLCPDRSVITSTDGKIETTWVGAPGNVVLLIPIDTTQLLLVDSGFAGTLTCNRDWAYAFDGSLISMANLPNAKSITAVGAQLNEAAQKLILDNAYTLALRMDIRNGFIDMAGAVQSLTGSDISTVHGIDYGSILTTLTSSPYNWSITATEE
jgi:hypothetical protein